VILSFDLDDTLIPSTKLFRTEKQNILQRILGVEKIRYGTHRLINQLRADGHHIYIYTSSLRSSIAIRFIFWTYGIPIDKVINKQRHDKAMGSYPFSCSKYPPAFEIDIHIDDSPGLLVEAKNYDFCVSIIDPQELDWGNLVVKSVKEKTRRDEKL